ncbi:MAG TPA: glycosyltransferase family 39 protein, partial [Verrucomicrobiae bacterium]|nr:glycosyltransferase family 39 protein [Verrucomicrobiae bacterium]
MDKGVGLARRNWITAALLFGASMVMRVPFRSQLAYHWDSAQFALAIADYDPTRSLPQAPGYFLYVMLGRLVNTLVHDPHASLVWISVVAGSALVALGYLLGTSMFGASCGWATAVILATSPLCWFHSEIALSYIVDAALVTATVLVCWQAVQKEGGWRHVVILSALMALVAGVRQQTAPILVPVCIYGFVGMARPRWPKFGVSVILTALLCLAWFVPMVRMSGGLTSYWAALEAKARFDALRTPWRGGFAVLWKNADRIASMCWAGLHAAAVIATLLFTKWVL